MTDEARLPEELGTGRHSEEEGASALVRIDGDYPPRENGAHPQIAETSVAQSISENERLGFRQTIGMHFTQEEADEAHTTYMDLERANGSGKAMINRLKRLSVEEVNSARDDRAWCEQLGSKEDPDDRAYDDYDIENDLSDGMTIKIDNEFLPLYYWRDQCEGSDYVGPGELPPHRLRKGMKMWYDSNESGKERQCDDCKTTIHQRLSAGDRARVIQYPDVFTPETGWSDTCMGCGREMADRGPYAYSPERKIWHHILRDENGLPTKCESRAATGAS